MRQRTHTRWILAAGLILLAFSGCSTKWLSAGSESEGPDGGRSSASTMASLGAGTQDGSGSSSIGSSRPQGSFPDSLNRFDSPSSGLTDSDTSSRIPSLSAQGSHGDASERGGLSGFDRLAPGQEPSEERVDGGPIASRMMTPDVLDKRMAELRREEDAAIAAGFKDAFFGYDRTSIADETRDALSSDAEWIRSHPAAKVKVSGHCDERGTQDYNLVLGDKRAKAVKRYLVDLGVEPHQVVTISFGKNRPFCAEHDESCYRQDRRGHFLLSAE